MTTLGSSVHTIGNLLHTHDLYDHLRAVPPAIAPYADPLTFGDMLRWNPHFHAIVLEGGFDDQGTFVYIPLGHLQAMTELLRRRVVALLVDQKLLDRRFARNMLSWRHSGFSVDNSVRILDRGVQRSLAEYVSRPAISAQALEEDPL